MNKIYCMYFSFLRPLLHFIFTSHSRVADLYLKYIRIKKIVLIFTEKSTNFALMLRSDSFQAAAEFIIHNNIKKITSRMSSILPSSSPDGSYIAWKYPLQSVKSKREYFSSIENNCQKRHL